MLSNRSGQGRVVPLPARRRPGPDRILLVQDDLAGQEHLLRMASHLARRLGAAVLVQHVLERDARGGYPTYAPTDPGTAERLIDRVLDRLEAEGIPARGEVTITLSGFKAEAILSTMVESGAELTIIEARRLSPFLAPIGLSPIYRIIRSGHCPVLLVPPARRPSLALRLRFGLRRLWARSVHRAVAVTEDADQTSRW